MGSDGASFSSPAREGGFRLAGYAAVFGTADGVGDVIRPGAFAATLAARRAHGSGPLPLYWQHRPQQRIGWVERAEEDTRGLRVIAAIDAPASRAAQLLGTRGVDGLSFGYRVTQFRRTAAGRDLEAVDLAEISLVTHPMHPAARVHFVC